MKRIFSSSSVLLGVLVLVALSSCNNDQSYADRLNEDRNAVNSGKESHINDLHLTVKL